VVPPPPEEDPHPLKPAKAAVKRNTAAIKNILLVMLPPP
jgi:hypothetical protein